MSRASSPEMTKRNNKMGRNWPHRPEVLYDDGFGQARNLGAAVARYAQELGDVEKAAFAATDHDDSPTSLGAYRRHLWEDADRLLETLRRAQGIEEDAIARFVDSLGVLREYSTASSTCASANGTGMHPNASVAAVSEAPVREENVGRRGPVKLVGVRLKQPRGELDPGGTTTPLVRPGVYSRVSISDARFNGSWEDLSGIFYGGAMISISADTWHPCLQHDLQRPATYSMRAVSPDTRLLAEIRHDAVSEEYAFQIAQGNENGTLLATEVASGAVHVLHRAATPGTGEPPAPMPEAARTMSGCDASWPTRPTQEDIHYSVGLKFLEEDELEETKPSMSNIDEVVLSQSASSTAASGAGVGWLRKINYWWTKGSSFWEQMQEPQRTGTLSTFVTGVYFEMFCFMIIFLNGVFIVVKTNYGISHLDEQPDSHIFESLEVVFVAYYCFELVAKLLVHQQYFFCNKDMGFNIFDAVVVTVAVFEQALSATSSRSYLRLVRVFKMVRVLRVARGLRFVSPIRLVLDMLVLSMFALLRCIMLLAFILCIFAILFTQTTSEHMRSITPQERLEEGNVQMLQAFGSVWTSMVSLFMAVSGGDDWTNQYSVFRESDMTASRYVYLFFILFFTVAFWNIVTGQFMQETLKAAAPDMDELLLQKRKQDVADVKALLALVKKADEDHNGLLTKREFAKLMADKQFRSYFEARGIDIKDTEMFFDMMTAGSNGQKQQVELSLFVWGCLRMKGMATSVDLHSMDFELRLMHQTQRHLFEYVTELLERIASTQQQEVAILPSAIGCGGEVASTLQAAGARDALQKPDPASRDRLWGVAADRLVQSPKPQGHSHS